MNTLPVKTEALPSGIIVSVYEDDAPVSPRLIKDNKAVFFLMLEKHGKVGVEAFEKRDVDFLKNDLENVHMFNCFLSLYAEKKGSPKKYIFSLDNKEAKNAIGYIFLQKSIEQDVNKARKIVEAELLDFERYANKTNVFKVIAIKDGDVVDFQSNLYFDNAEKALNAFIIKNNLS